MSESALLRSVMRRLELMPGVHPMRRNAGLTVLGKGRSRRAIHGCEAGTPDVEVMLRGGRVVWLELKAPRGRVTPVQERWHAMAAEMGHTVHVVRTLDDAVAAVEQAMVTDPVHQCYECGKPAHFICINEECCRCVGEFSSGYNAGYHARIKEGG